MEGKAEDAEVDDVSGEVAFGPAPVAVFYDEAGIGGQDKVAPASRSANWSPPLEERNPQGHACGAEFVRATMSLRTATFGDLRD